ncbi:MAG: bifunctional diaminohydroxyphosphoribosylaminopyrimidine deaminase/5-amino-6-(5-phosphoribosylamino)uracil reductase RibD [Betaproteobacteria bacterium]|nr:bifunctional diaminohydroxyphosphoribosylaminopyrimidine deaminase/5-amino-6-(5-phosphoribosylamino)uracil reductase RibD [Betaproteobacteria bacterium]MBI3055692.1 bifunctional diaminohydroxyphosphoribosylaminopyrimidine deaminase/5-amino-6-(5-phosphoribosylamino)uracil reductase RibD [Betaproteobacteria bacterium]
MSFSAEDHSYMAQALQLAQRGLYTTTPNPRVGCVIVRDGAVVGEGWHERAGAPHAEIHALAAAGDRARGATAYVTLEPCHHHGRTPPCDEALIAAGVARVVAAMRDPDPRTAGLGLERIIQAGVVTASGVLEHEAREVNIGFVSRLTRGRPWVRMKIAASLDGKTALLNGKSRWITGEAARTDGHHWRARACAVLTGIGTVRDDDPQLTVRAVDTPRQPRRVVVDSRLETPLTARILAGGGVLIACAVEDKTKIGQLQNQGAEVIVMPNGAGKVELPALMQELGRREINELHVEAGCKLNGSLINEGCVDELLLYFAPCLIGERARGMAELPELADLGDRRGLKISETRMVGSDLRILARLEAR